jgi:hypothetical protein
MMSMSWYKPNMTSAEYNMYYLKQKHWSEHVNKMLMVPVDIFICN